MRLQPLYIRLQPRHIRVQPLHIRLQPLYIRLQPRYIRLQVATAVAGDGETLPTEASMVWLLDVERLRDVELLDTEGAGSTPLQLVLEALDGALTSDAVRVLSY